MNHHFCQNFKTQQFPSHLSSFCKQDLLNIKHISKSFANNIREVNFNFTSNYLPKPETLSKSNYCFMYLVMFNVLKVIMYLDINHMKHHLERVSIEGLSSLKFLSLKLESIEENSFGKMNSLTELTLDVKSEMNNDMSTKLFETCPNIEKLCLSGKFSNINLDNFVNLKKLRLCGDLSVEFNFDLFKNICNQLEELWIGFNNMNDESISKLLCGHNFPNVSNLSISFSQITRLEKKLFDGFPMLQSLAVIHSRIVTIERDAFSNLKNLKSLSLSYNPLSYLDPELFSCLRNLEELDLRYNEFMHFDSRILDYVVNIKRINLENNPIMNQEIENRFKQMNINYTLGYYIEDYF